MRIYLPVLCVCVLFAASVAAQNAAPAPVTGVIQSFDGKLLTIKADDGSAVAAALIPSVPITVRVKRTLADIKPGDFVASGGTRGPDGKLHANEIRIIAVPTPSGEGQFPMSQPGQGSRTQPITTPMLMRFRNAPNRAAVLSGKSSGNIEAADSVP